RMMFNEERFEELLACRTSSSTWRAWLSPIVESASESLLFIGLLFLLLALDLFFLLTGRYESYFWSSSFKALPLGLLALAIFRLSRKQRTFHKCLNHLQIALGSLEKANHVIYRLSDQEITHFSKLPPSDIKEYAIKKSKEGESLRWRILFTAYFHSHLN